MMSMDAPQQSEAWQQDVLRQIQSLLAGDVNRATDVALDALSKGMVHPLLLHLYADRLEKQGRFGEALQVLDRASTIAPDDLFILTAMAANLLNQRDAPNALKVINRALEIDPHFPQANWRRGRILRRLGDIDGARASFVTAAEVGDYADPLADLAASEAHEGRYAEAARLAERALVIDPTQSLAAITLAQCALREGRTEEAEARARNILQMQTMVDEDRASVFAILGEALEEQGRYDEAFAAYAEGKANDQRLYAPRFRGPGKESHLDLVRRISAEFDRTAPEQWQASVKGRLPGASEEHVFLLGFPRSGTTLLERTLARHPDLDTLDERVALIDAEEAFVAQPTGIEELAKLVPGKARGWRDLYWRRTDELGRDKSKKVFIDKLPLNTINMPLIAKFFPNTKILFAVRDPRDVVLSCAIRSFAINAAMYEFTSLQGAALYYDAVMSLAMKYQSKLTLDLIEVHHEEVVTDFQGQLERVCRFIGVPWDETMRDFASETGRPASRTPSAAQLRQGLTDRGVGRWRRFERQLAPVMPILEPWIAHFGYS